MNALTADYVWIYVHMGQSASDKLLKTYIVYMLPYKSARASLSKLIGFLRGRLFLSCECISGAIVLFRASFYSVFKPVIQRIKEKRKVVEFFMTDGENDAYMEASKPASTQPTPLFTTE